MKIFIGETPENPCEDIECKHSPCCSLDGVPSYKCLEKTVYDAQLSIINQCVEVDKLIQWAFENNLVGEWGDLNIKDLPDIISQFIQEQIKKQEVKYRIIQ